MDLTLYPVELQTALEALYGHYEKTFDLWKTDGINVPPCFIIVCNNTSTSKLIYDYISGFERPNEDGSTSFTNGRLKLFRNYDDNGNAFGRPNTLLIDSHQLESGEALDTGFRTLASDEIERFRREIIERTGDQRAADSIDDATLLREVMNTVGKEGKLGESIRRVVSVSMLTEGWDANTVTHVLGVRAFGTQLLCEQHIKVILDASNQVGSSSFVNFTTSMEDRWQTAANKCHVNWAIMDSDWEAEFCRVVESHPQVLCYAKNHGLGFEVPYRMGSEAHKYRPDFIVYIDDGHGPDDPLKLIIEIKGYRLEDAKVKKETMDVYWVPGANNSGKFGRWAFAEFCDVYEIEMDFKKKIEAQFAAIINANISVAQSSF